MDQIKAKTNVLEKCSCGHEHGHEEGHKHIQRSQGEIAAARAKALLEGQSALSLQVTGLDCAECAKNLVLLLKKLNGVLQADLNFSSAKLIVEYDKKITQPEAILRAIKQVGYGVENIKFDNNYDVYLIDGVDCPECAKNIQIAVAALPKVDEALFNFSTLTLKVKHNGAQAEIMKIVRNMGYDITKRSDEKLQVSKKPWWLETKTVMTGISGLCCFISWLLTMSGADVNYTKILMIIAAVIGGYYPAKAGLAALRHGFALDINVLLILAVGGAFYLGEYQEAGTVTFLFSLGKVLEYYSMEKTRQSIRSLMDLAPPLAVVLRDGQQREVPLAEIAIGETVIVRPGEKIGVDGIISKGDSHVNQAAITGEPLAVAKKVGEAVYAGTVNEDGYLEIQVTRLVDDTTLAKIISMVEEAQAQKAPSQRFVDIFARYYTPAVIALALGIITIPPLLLQQDFAAWFYRGISLLVVSCPCALVISTPVAIVSAIGNAAKQGVLIKGGAYLEQTGRLASLAFDKTGTLTKGLPEVSLVVASQGCDKQKVLSIAASVEMHSEHPLAQAIIAMAEQEQIAYSKPSSFKALAGRGVYAQVDNKECYICKPEYAREELNCNLDELAEAISESRLAGATVMVVIAEGQVIGMIAVADHLREESYDTIKKLRQNGIKNIVMLTGDHQKTAATIANSLNLDEVHAELLPGDKANVVKALMNKYQSVAMVGDGINDAPALATATIGIAMGGAGSDTALETADIVLMADDLSKLPYAIKLSKDALKIIKQNIWFALIVKLAAITLVFPDILTLWIAIMADSGAALLVILNGMRLLRKRP